MPGLQHWLQRRDSPAKLVLSEAQRRMYASEKTDNFRWLARILTHHSSYTLTSSDCISAESQLQLADIGQFAELAHGSLAPEFIWKNMDRLLRPDYPLDGYDALRGSTLVSVFHGTRTDLQGYITYRAEAKQLVLAFSGTSSLMQGLHDLCAWFTNYPAGVGCTVHAGFWKMYMGVRDVALEHLIDALSAHKIDEVVLTGHSLGGAMCYLFALLLLGAQDNPTETSLPSLPRLKLVVFGCPRIGNLALAQLWHEIAARASVVENSVRAYNDGATAVPPLKLGYRHFCQTPLYLAEGRVFRIPPADSECSYFAVNVDDTTRAPSEFPRGGHNYYNGRDMEKTLRRMWWLQLSRHGEAGWEERYQDCLRREESTPRHDSS